MTFKDSAAQIDISFHSGELRLFGVLHLPSTPNPPVIVGSHGLASDGNSAKQIELANTCTALGMAYFRFHHRGCGTSEGRFADETTLDNRKKDLIAAVEAVLARKDTGDRLALFGSSMGGATCIAAARELQAEGYVVVAPPVVGDTLTQPPENLSSDPDLTDEFYRRLRDFDLTADLSAVKNVLIIHGDKDAIVPLENSQTLFRLAGKPKKLIVQKGGDHRISDPEHQKEFIRESSQWFRHCFGL